MFDNSPILVATTATREDAERHVSVRSALAARIQNHESFATDVPGQIRKLAELRDAGILTAEEFDAKKADLLARM
jgi:hypothetical protein